MPSSSSSWRSRPALAASCGVPAAATADMAFGALVAALPRPALAKQLLSEHSSSSRQWRRLDRHLRSGLGAVERPCGGEVWVIADPVQRHIALSERGAATDIVSVVRMTALPRRTAVSVGVVVVVIMVPPVRYSAGGPRQPCPTAACRSRRSRSSLTALCGVPAAATTDMAFGALRAALPRPLLVKQ